MSYVLAVLALAVMGAYVCRVDELSWWRTPWLMLLHAGGGSVSAWVMYHASMGHAGGAHVLALAAAAVLLWLTWEHLPGRRADARRAMYQTDLMVSAPLIGRRDVPIDPHDRDRLQ